VVIVWVEEMKLLEIMKEKAEQSAGIILYRKKIDVIEYLLLNGDAIGWGFPKGHIDDGESHKATAKRETYEETGLKVSKLESGFKQEVKYFLKKNWSTGKQYDKPKLKIVTYFLAEVPSKAKVKISNEHIGFEWFTYGKAKKKQMFNKKLLKYAKDYILAK
jgi:8-oxo-dGTP pyrophosphatase MutT (NUDIX family)